MQVSDNPAESAILGSVKQQSMGIASTPEFIQILSSTLYKYQELAFVRETIANAWDAHIDSQKLTTPIEVKVTDDVFSVIDHGSGIAPESMVAVYGIYGQGTKVNDKNATGGMGLGCKSPFAYVDAFEVVSCHKGTMTIYQIAKTEGLPSIVTMGSMPTDKTGLSVNINIKANDKSKLFFLAREVIRGGDILASLNDELVEGIGLNTEVASVCCFFCNNNIEVDLPHLQGTKFVIRYANMLYPLPGTDNDYIQDKLSRIKPYLPECRQFIIQAENDSLSVQPSREGLSETDKTLDNICNLLDQVYGKFTLEYNTNYKKYRKEYLLATAKTMQSKVMADSYKNKTIPSHWGVSPTDPDQLSIEYYVSDLIENNYPKVLNYQDLIKVYCINRNFSYTEEVKLKVLGSVTPDASGLDRGVCNIFRQHVLKPKCEDHMLLFRLYRKLFVTGSDVPKATLYVSDRCGVYKFPTKYRYNHPDISKFEGRKVILTTKKNLEYEKGDSGCLIYHINRTNKAIKEAREFLATTGYTIIDRIEERAKEPRKKATPTNSVRSLIHPNGVLGFYDHAFSIKRTSDIQALLANSSTKIISNPKYIVRLTKKQGYFQGTIPGMYSDVVKYTAPYLKDHVGVVFSKAEENKWKPKTVLLGNFLVSQIKEKWDEIKEDYVELKANSLKHGYNKYQRFIDEIVSIDQFHDLLPWIPASKSGKYYSFETDIKELHRNISHSNTLWNTHFDNTGKQEWERLYKEISDCSPSPEVEKFYNQVVNFFNLGIEVNLDFINKNPEKVKPSIEVIIKQIRNMPHD